MISLWRATAAQLELSQFSPTFAQTKHSKMQPTNPPNIIIYNTVDGKASVPLFAKDGQVWMNQNQIAELFDTSKQNIGQHITNILEESELAANSVVKYFFTTAADGKEKAWIDKDKKGGELGEDKLPQPFTIECSSFTNIQPF